MEIWEPQTYQFLQRNICLGVVLKIVHIGNVDFNDIGYLERHKPRLKKLPTGVTDL